VLRDAAHSDARALDRLKAKEVRRVDRGARYSAADLAGAR